MNWVKRLFSKASSKKRVINSNPGMSFDEIYQDPGAFQYDIDGFTIKYKDFTKRVNWTDITQLNVFKVDQITIDRIDMQIICGNEGFTISEELPGWYQFVLKTKEVFPSIPKDWDLSIIQPAFATNFRTIYKKENTTAK